VPSIARRQRQQFMRDQDFASRGRVPADVAAPASSDPR
jgi:hypothetical protein